MTMNNIRSQTKMKKKIGSTIRNNIWIGENTSYTALPLQYANNCRVHK